MRNIDLPLFDFTPLGGHGEAPADIKINLANDDRRMVTVLKAGHEALGGAVVASDLIPGASPDRQIWLDVEQVLIVKANGKYYTLFALRGGEEVSGKTYISIDADRAPPLDCELSVVRSRAYRVF